MERDLVTRGALAGLAAGVLAFVFSRIFVEPQVAAAIAYESGRDDAQAALDKLAGLPAAASEPEVFSRTIQANLGLGVGLLVFGLALGLMFAVVFALVARNRTPARPRLAVVGLAAAAFAGTYLIPTLKYPANPPAIGHPDTIGARTGLFLIMVVCCCAGLIGAVWLRHRLQRRFTAWNATLLAGGAFIVVIGIVMLLLPAPGQLPMNLAEYGRQLTETPLPLTDPKGVIVYPGFPADVLARFRLVSAINQLILWTTLALVFAPMAEKVLAPDRSVAEHRVAS